MFPLEFKIDVSRSGRHRAHLTLDVETAAVPRDGSSLELFLPVWTPGSYLVREYARHIERFSASDADSGAAVTWRKTAKNRFQLEPPAGCERVRVSYAVYGQELTVRTSDFTDRHAYWNGACVCLWPVGGEQLAAGLEVTLPDGWQLATQLPRTQSSPVVRLEARNLDDVVDAPCLAGPLDVREFEVLGRPHSFVIDGLEGVAVPDSLLADTERIINEAAAIFGGEVPYEQYQFLALFSHEGRGGLEHRDSSTLLAPRTTFHPPKSYESFAGLIAHEFFHVWNGKRMRPLGLWEFDYERENYTTLLWVTEGFTAYYDDHLCLRAGVVSSNRYLKILSENLSSFHRTPGRLLHPLSSSSFDAWIKLYRPDENSRNSTQSYYTHGALAAMCFDLRIRAATDGERSLDDAVADLYRSTFGQGRGYGDDDVVAALSRAADQDMAPLKAELVDGPFDPNFEEFLSPLGLHITEKASDQAQFGVLFRAGELRLASVLDGGAASAAQLAPGDEVLAVNGLRVTRSTWPTVLQNLWRPGEQLELLLSRRGVILERTVTPEPETTQSWRIERSEDADADAIQLRQAWLCEPSQ